MSNLSYLSFLATDDFLPGVLVLAHSLRKTRPKAPLLVLVTDNVSEKTLLELERGDIGFKVIEAIPFPEGLSVNEPRWRHNYSKLRVFEQTQFSKLVYLDADMVVCANLDELFDRPHMSGVNAGGLLRRNAAWVGMNTGLMVVEPDEALFRKMVSEVGKRDGKGHGDQAFINSFFPDWPERPELHLHHTYNQIHVFLEDHWFHFGYRLMKGNEPTPTELKKEKLVRVIHYISGEKPWVDLEATRRLIHRKRWTRPLTARSLKLWLELYDEVRQS